MRPLVADISLSHLKENYLFLKSMHGSKLLAVVKANAYGHGSLECAKALDKVVDGFAVAFLEEAIVLREQGIVSPIVLLEGIFDAKEYSLVDAYRLWAVIQNEAQLKYFDDYSWKNQTIVWLKMDTGMRRAGFFPVDYEKIFYQLNKHSSVKQIVKMSHFASADELDHDFILEQLKVFNRFSSNLPGESSLSNSAAVLRHPNTYRNWGRVGISLYGISPFEFFIPELKPVMKFHSKIFGVKTLKAGESIGYGLIFTAEKDIRVGLVACGYADGYPRVPSNNNPIYIDGIKSRVIGRVSMDMMTVELNHELQGMDSQVEFWGENISVNEIAQRAETISYEVLCHVKRAKFNYLE